ncbi:hypothetical protein BH23BAC1_BH23BAC1_25390 [soil metagenome]
MSLYNITCLACLLTYFSGNLFAQTQIPNISDFVPVSAAVDTEITIKGSNFSTSGNPVVFFGAVKAITVTVVNSGQIKVTVPAGATYAPLTVIVNGLTANSKTPFLPTFAGDPSVTLKSNHFSKFELANAHSNNYNRTVLVGDIDNDNNPDLLVSESQNSSFFGNKYIKNNHQPTSEFNDDSFSPPANFTSKKTNSHLLADLNNDGILDRVLAVNDGGWKMQIESSEGFSKFFVNQNISNEILMIYVSDLNADGKPDIIASVGSAGDIYIYKNNFLPGGAFDQNSFDAPVILKTGAEIKDFDVVDIDLDGHSEILVVTEKELVVYKNNPVTINNTTFSLGSEEKTEDQRQGEYITNDSAKAEFIKTKSFGQKECKCPDGSVAVGYQGITERWLVQFQMLCRKLKPDGTLEGKMETTFPAGGNGGGRENIKHEGPYTLENNVLIGARITKTPWDLQTFTGFGKSITDIHSNIQPDTLLKFQTIGPFRRQVAPLPLVTAENKHFEGSEKYYFVDTEHVITGFVGDYSIRTVNNQPQDHYFLGIKFFQRKLIKTTTSITHDLNFEKASTKPLTNISNPLIEIADLNKDGKPDLILHSDASLQIWFNNNNFNFDTEEIQVNGKPWMIAVNDFNGDSSPDIAVASRNSSSTTDLSIFTSKGTAQVYQKEIEINLNDITQVWGLSSGDLNKDGKPEIIVNSADKIFILKNNFPTAGTSTLPSLIIGNINYESDGSVSIQIEASNNGSLDFQYRGLTSEADYTNQGYQINGESENNYIISLSPDNLKDVLGIEFKVKATNSAGSSPELERVVSKLYPDGVTIPYTQFGNGAKFYELIAISLDLDNKSVGDIFKDELGDPNNINWRIVSYSGNPQDPFTNLKGHSPLEVGKAYWMIVKDNPGKALVTGPGKAESVQPGQPYKESLNTNDLFQVIGNPYPFDLSWNDIESANPGIINRIAAFNVLVDGEYKDIIENPGYLLKSFRGAILQLVNNPSAPTQLIFPFRKDSELDNGRISQTQEVEEEGWLVNLDLTNGERKYSLGGLGMHNEAENGLDIKDRLLLPHFGEPFNLKFNTPVDENYYLTRDIVPPNIEHVWELVSETSTEGSEVELAWSNIPEQGEGLWLYDVESQHVVDMHQQRSYRFPGKSGKPFKVYYGTREQMPAAFGLQEPMLMSIYPNPIRHNQQARIPFNLPPSNERYQVELSIYNPSGGRITSLLHGEYQGDCIMLIGMERMSLAGICHRACTCAVLQ